MPTLDLKRLRVLAELHRHGTVVATAQHLGLTPSAISQHLSSLQRELGVTLTEPDGRSIRLTNEALIVLDHYGALIDQLQRLQNDLTHAQNGERGRVRIGGFGTVMERLLPPLIRRIRAETPLIDISVLQIEPPECFELLDSGDLDLAITVQHGRLPADSNPRYHKTDLFSDPVDVLLPRSHPSARQQALRFTDLRADHWISCSTDSCCGTILRSLGIGSGFVPEITSYCDDWPATQELVAAGLGVALLPRFVQGADAHPLTQIVPLVERPTRTVSVFTRSGAQDHPVYARVLKTLAAISHDHE